MKNVGALVFVVSLPSACGDGDETGDAALDAALDGPAADGAAGIHANMGGHFSAQRVAVLRTVGHAISSTSAGSFEIEDATIVGVDARATDERATRRSS